MLRKAKLKVDLQQETQTKSQQSRTSKSKDLTQWVTKRISYQKRMTNRQVSTSPKHTIHQPSNI